MELRDKYLHAISKQQVVERKQTADDENAAIDDMKFALEFLKFSGKKEASPNEIAAVAKVAEFYRKYYSAEKKSQRQSQGEKEVEE